MRKKKKKNKRKIIIVLIPNKKNQNFLDINNNNNKHIKDNKSKETIIELKNLSIKSTENIWSKISDFISNVPMEYKILMLIELFVDKNNKKKIIVVNQLKILIKNILKKY